MSEEIWKDIKDYERLYQVSNLGDIRSLKRINKLGRTVNEKTLSKCVMGRSKYVKVGYYGVVLYKNGERKVKLVHRLVAQAFISNPNNYPVINHKDEFDTLNNRIENLEWCTYSYNNNYGTKVDRIANKESMEVYQYSENREFIKKWKSVNDCGRNGYLASKVCLCCNGKRNKHRSYLWSYTKLKEEA